MLSKDAPEFIVAGEIEIDGDGHWEALVPLKKDGEPLKGAASEDWTAELIDADGNHTPLMVNAIDDEGGTTLALGGFSRPESYFINVVSYAANGKKTWRGQGAVAFVRRPA